MGGGRGIFRIHEFMINSPSDKNLALLFNSDSINIASNDDRNKVLVGEFYYNTRNPVLDRCSVFRWLN